MAKSTRFAEKELLLLLKQKDTSAFSYLYDEYAPSIYGIIVREVKSPQLASDILKSTFINIANECDNIDCIKNSLFSWMLQLARITAEQEFKANLGFQSIIASQAARPAVTNPEFSEQLNSGPIF